MAIFDSLLALIQLGIQYLKLKNQTVFFDLCDSFESQLDKLSARRESLRKETSSEAQQKADDIMDQILEIQKRKKLFLADWKNNKL